MEDPRNLLQQFKFGGVLGAATPQKCLLGHLLTRVGEGVEIVLAEATMSHKPQQRLEAPCKERYFMPPNMYTVTL